jgi:hypothetical protein
VEGKLKSATCHKSGLVYAWKISKCRRKGGKLGAERRRRARARAGLSATAATRRGGRQRGREKAIKIREAETKLEP